MIFKAERISKSYVFRIMFLMCVISLATFTTFSMDPIDDKNDRLSNAFTLVLTALVFMFVIDAKLPNIPYMCLLDYYIYSTFLLMMLIAIETAFLFAAFENQNDLVRQWDKTFSQYTGKKCCCMYFGLCFWPSWCKLMFISLSDSTSMLSFQVTTIGFGSSSGK